MMTPIVPSLSRPTDRSREATIGAFSVGRAVVILLLLLVPGFSAYAQPTVIRAGVLVDVVKGTVIENVEILVEGNRIRQVAEKVKAGRGATLIDLRDRTVLPGLIDSHTHICLTPEDSDHSPVLHKTNPYRALEGLQAAQRSLMAGFTTLRDLDNEGADMADIAVRDAVRGGMFVGPRLFVSGWALSITAGHMNLNGLRPSVDRRLEQLAILVDSKDAMVAAVRDQVKTGVDFIKVYTTGAIRHIDPQSLESLPQLSVEEVRLIVDEAARWRMDVAAHAYGGEGAYDAVAGGVRSIEHGMLLDDRTLDLMVEMGTFWAPTLTPYFPNEEDTPERTELLERIVQRHRDTFQRALKKGVKIVFGTDVGSFPHGEGWRELEQMAEYGMPPMEILRSATLVGAELLRKEDELGRIEPGYLADIIAVKGRPGRDIEALRAVDFVMVDGKVVKPAP